MRNKLLVSLEDVENLAPKFVVYPYLPVGELVTLDGHGGSGKSSWSLLLGASVNNEVEGFEVSPEYLGQNVVYLSLEDRKEIIKHRFSKTGFSAKNFYVCDDAEELFRSPVKYVEKVCEAYNPAMVIIDPVTYLIPQGVDMYKATDVGRWLSGFRDIADRFSTSIVLIKHLTKSGGNSHISRGNGSFVFHARVRSALLACKEEEFLHILQTKASYSSASKAKKWRFLEDGVLFFDGESDKNESELLSDEKAIGPKVSDCEEQILHVLSEGDGAFSSVLHRRLSGFSGKTISRAKKALQEKKLVGKTLKNQKWYWFLSTDGGQDGQV